MLTGNRWFWQDSELMNWLIDERTDVYFKYIDRTMRYVEAGYMSPLEKGQFLKFMRNMAEKTNMECRGLMRLISH